MNFIEVKDVVKQYDGHLAVNHVSMDVPDGCIYGLLGPNGAGKTSLIRVINQITKPDSGVVLFHGQPLKPSDVENIGYMPEERGLYKKMKVGEQIIYLARLKGLSKFDAETRMKEWLERFQLTEWKDKKLETLSKGMAQKVQFIATVIHRPPLLIFDEPFSGFDPVNAEILKHEIIELKKEGAAILFSTHNMSSVEEICEQITLMNHAEVVLQGHVNEIRQRYKKHLYNLSIAETLFQEMPDLFAVEKSEAAYGGGLNLQIRLNDNVAIRDIIAMLNEKYSLTGFQEILPSMQEVFIETVAGKSPEEVRLTGSMA